MQPEAYYSHLLSDFPFTPTVEQDKALEALSRFVLGEEKNELFLLKGYAGTGKTTIISTLVKKIWKTRMGCKLLAPTGRAAKVISNYSKKAAHTIHREIYHPKPVKGGAGVQFKLKNNKTRNAIYIVDEASMIPDVPDQDSPANSSSLLDDLIEYVYSGKGCKLLIIGDGAQLPPVKLDISPALEEGTLSMRYGLHVISQELSEVKRQAEGSGILANATRIRNYLQKENYGYTFDLQGYEDIVRLVDGHEIMDAINRSYDNFGFEETAIIVRSNKRANLYNQQIRSRILFRESELAAGDFLMVVKNNYHWLESNSQAGFIANGDIVEVLEIFGFKELYDFKFAEAKVRMVDYPDQKPFETMLLLDTLTSESPSLTYEESGRLYKNIAEDFKGLAKYKQYKGVKESPYFNALQVKFSHAITCHKSQGGQWENVIVECPYLPEGPDRDYLRWLYTAVTRARSTLYLIGFKNDSFTESSQI